MEYLDNDHDRGIYWIIFFVFVIAIAIIGYIFVFHYDKKSDNVTEKEENYSEDVNKYKGIWALLSDEELPNEELIISKVDDSTITFDYYIKDVAHFDSQTADIQDNTATFDITDRNDKINISGKMIFRDDKISLVITSSSVEDISLGTIEYIEKENESLLRDLDENDNANNDVDKAQE